MTETKENMTEAKGNMTEAKGNMTEAKRSMTEAKAILIAALIALGGAGSGYLVNRYVEGDALTIAIISDISSKIELFNSLCKEHFAEKNDFVGKNDFFELFPFPENSSSTVVEVSYGDFRKENHFSVYDKAVEKLGHLRPCRFIFCFPGEAERKTFVKSVVEFYDKAKLSRDHFSLLIAMDQCIPPQSGPYKYKCNANSISIIRNEIRDLLHQAIDAGNAAIKAGDEEIAKEILEKEIFCNKSAVTAAPPSP
jgi:hypothetical protein